MTLRILCVGKISESFFRDAVAEYVKRLGRYAKTEIVEVPDEKTPEGASSAEVRRILDREGARILEKIRDRDYCVALAVDGAAMSSEEFAGHLSELLMNGNSVLTFVIGGSLGLSEKVLNRCREKLSFSRFTFPHQLMRVILCEQLYRAMRIRNGEPYHK